MEVLCSICTENFTNSDSETICSTQCGHIFHYHCLLQWLESSKTCPHCRKLVNTNMIIKLNFCCGDTSLKNKEGNHEDMNINSAPSQTNFGPHWYRNSIDDDRELCADILRDLEKEMKEKRNSWRGLLEAMQVSPSRLNYLLPLEHNKIDLNAYLNPYGCDRRANPSSNCRI